MIYSIYPLASLIISLLFSEVVHSSLCGVIVGYYSVSSMLLQVAQGLQGSQGGQQDQVERDHPEPPVHREDRDDREDQVK